MPVTAPLFWVIAAAVFGALEAATVGVTSIWFACGSLAGMIASFATDNIWIQIGAFLLVSFICLISFRPLAVKYLSARKTQPTNADRIVGQEAVVQEAISNLQETGAVKVMGQVWTARSESGTDIPAGSIVVVDRIEGVKVFVTPVTE